MAPEQTRRLVIVESAQKAKRIARYLGPNYVVEASVGHIRDLPKGAADVPAKYKKEPWARLGVDPNNDFKALYVVSSDKKAKVTDLKRKLKDVDELFLATDPDREGEAIAWHLLEVLKPKVPVRRMVFHEITEPAIKAAAEATRELDQDLVDAQETRRILDRLYGYEISPVLWKKVMPRLSAGRVQSVATRVIVERERERMAFIAAGYFDLTAQLDTPRSQAADAGEPTSLKTRLTGVDGTRVATGRDFTDRGELTAKAQRDGVVVLNEEQATVLAGDLTAETATVASVESKPYTRKPYAPFMTSTLQQEAGRKLHFTSERTMRIAQRLYENGHITYMRTDSTTLSQSGIAAARQQAEQLYGPNYVSPSPRQYTRKVKNSQEAHEAIRPAGERFATPGELRSQLDPEEFRLYELIWQRTVASQMADAKGTSVSVKITADAKGHAVELSTSGRTITFPGFLAAYVEVQETASGAQVADNAEKRLPQLAEGQRLTVTDTEVEGHTTNPPARYNEASLVKKMEELGIGRPSTYASIIKTIQDRGYVYSRGNALVPSWVAFAVVGLMETKFGSLVDYDFTSAMEDELDQIATGQEDRTEWLKAFYFGNEDEAGSSGADDIARLGGLHALVDKNLESIDARAVNSLHLFDDAEGHGIFVRVGRYGPYLERTLRAATDTTEAEVQRANIPDSVTPDELTVEVAEKLLAMPQGGRELGVDPHTGTMIVAKDGRYGPYVTEVLPEDAGEDAKPRTASLLASMDPATVTLDDALLVLSLPRSVGVAKDGEEITAQTGRYGPYLKKGSDSRSLGSEEEIFTITLEAAERIYAEPKRRGRQAAKPPLAVLGTDLVSGKEMVVKDGRFGPYVTDGETNASLRRGDTPETLTTERASELLSERRAAAPKKATRKATKKAAKKTAKKVVKKAAKKATKKAAKKTAKKAT